MSQKPNGLAEIARLAIYPMSVFEHARYKAQLAKKAVFTQTHHGSMPLRHLPDRANVMHKLDDGVGVRVQYVCFQSAELGFVIEPEVSNFK